MGIGAAVAAGISATASIIKTSKAAKQERDAKKAIEQYDRQELTNVYGDLSVSTMGADLQREELARANATGVQALQQGGVRGLVGGLGLLQQGTIQQSRQIGAGLDIQQREINRLIAQDQTRIQKMMEQRENADLAGLGQQQAVGQQGVMSGIGDLAQIGASVSGTIGSGGMGGSIPRHTATSSGIKSQGLAGMGFSNPFS
jgi:hypothetical protein